MGDLDFTPILDEISSLLNGMIFSVMYFGMHCGKNILLLKHQTKTIMVALKDDIQWSTEFYTTVSSRDRSIKTSYKIEGHQNMVLLLDGEGRLWQLINAFEFSNEKDECLHLIDERCFYEWIPFKKFEYCKVLEITAVENGFACLLQNRKSNKMLQIFSSFNFNKIDDFTFEDLNFLKSESYHLSSLFSNTFSELKDTNKALIITDRISGRTYICSDKNSSIVNIANVPLIAVVLFEQKKCLLLCYKNGKFSFVLYNDGFDRINDCIAYVFKTVTCIEKCDCCESCVVWSDGIDLHHTKIEFDFAKPCFAKLAHLLVNHNVVGIKALKKVRSGIIAVTVNNFYYHLTVNTSLKPKEISMTTDEILTKIFEGGLKIDSLNKEINTATEYLKFKEMMQTNCLPQQVELNREHEYITLKINVKEIFRKDIWRIRQRASVKNKHFVEMTDLETDMCEGMTVKIKSSLMSKNELEISLVGDFGYNFDLIIIFLGKIEVDKNNEEEEVAKTLYEIAQKRNPYFKQEK